MTEHVLIANFVSVLALLLLLFLALLCLLCIRGKLARGRIK